MSSRNRTSKNSHRNSKERSNKNPSRTSKQRTSSSIDTSSLSRMSPKKTSSLVQPRETSAAPPSTSIAACTSSPRNPYFSPTTSDPGFNTNTKNVFNTNISKSYPHTQMDLSGVSTWTQAHLHLHQDPHCHQTSDFVYPSYDTTNTSTCPCHASNMDICHKTNTSGPVFGYAPLERWLEEDANDGGVLALQLGLQLRIDCTCIAMQDEAC